MTTSSTLVAHFEDADTAQKAMADLESAGFTAEQAGYVSHDGSGRLAERLEARNLPGSRSATGAVIGGVSGTLLGVAALVIPGIGPVLAAGPFALALAGAGVGATTGGLLGALSEIGVPEADAKRWADVVTRGGSLVAVRVNPDNKDRAILTLREHRPESLLEHQVAVKESGNDYDPANPHTDAPSYGDEGGAT